MKGVEEFPYTLKFLYCKGMVTISAEEGLTVVKLGKGIEWSRCVRCGSGRDGLGL